MRPLLVAAVLLAGCVSPFADDAGADGQATAAQNRDLADGAARAWSKDARLVGVVGPESALADDGWRADPSVGDGRATAWLYVYRAPDGTAHAVRVTPEGEVETSPEGETLVDRLDDAKEVDDAWRIDSDLAAQAARGDEAVAEALARDDARVVTLLAHTDHASPCWYVVVGGAGGPEVAAMVDAADGRVVDVAPWGMSMPFTVPGFGATWVDFGTPVHLEGDVVLEGGGREEHAFRLDRAEMQALLTLHDVQALPTQTIVWSVLDEEGEVVERGEVGPDDRTENARDVSFGLPSRGDHVLRFEVVDASPVPVAPASFRFVFDASWMQLDIDVGP